MSDLIIPSLSLIVAHADQYVIGRDNQLPWHLPEDLKRFKQLTMGHHLIMGRKTFVSLGRLLPGRTSVIVTRDPHFQVAGAKIAHSMAEAVAVCEGDNEPFLIGGAQLYAEGMPWVRKLYITRVLTEVAGDAFFPALDLATWQCTAETPHVSSSGLHYQDLEYVRRAS